MVPNVASYAFYAHNVIMLLSPESEKIYFS